MFKKRSNPSAGQANTRTSTITLDNAVTDSKESDVSDSTDTPLTVKSQLQSSHPSGGNTQKSVKHELNKDILPDTDDTDSTNSTLHTNKFNNATVDITQDKVDAATNRTGVKSQAAANVRQITVYDYKPDVCKDYKQTGFCSFGDSCKFIHDRSDYKQSWQIDAVLEQNKKQKIDSAALSYDDIARNKVKAVQSFKTSRLGFMNKANSSNSGSTAELPFACLICKQPFTEPVVTKCQHYFCQSCALKHHTKSPRCAVCNRPTNGIFNKAHDIIEQQKQATVAVQQSDADSDTET